MGVKGIPTQKHAVLRQTGWIQYVKYEIYTVMKLVKKYEYMKKNREFGKCAINDNCIFY